MARTAKRGGGFAFLLIFLGFILFVVSLFTDFFVCDDVTYGVTYDFEDVVNFGNWGSFGAIIIVFLSVAGPCLTLSGNKVLSAIGLIMPVACLAISAREFADLVTQFAESVPKSADVAWSIGIGAYAYVIGMLLMIIGAIIGSVRSFRKPAQETSE